MSAYLKLYINIVLLKVNLSNLVSFAVSKMQSSSLMKSESEFSTDEETLFVSAKQQSNGHVKNGFKHKNRVKT